MFDIDVETSLKRVGKEQDRIESEGAQFLDTVRRGYLTLAKMEPNRIKIVDSSRSIEEIHKDVIKLVDDLID